MPYYWPCLCVRLNFQHPHHPRDYANVGCSFLPVGHPKPEDAEKGAICPATGATLEHHKGKVEPHPKVAAGVCPVAHKTLEEAETAAA